MKIALKNITELNQVFASMLETAADPEFAYKIADAHIKLNIESDKIHKSYKPVKGWDDVLKLYNKAAEGLGGQRQPDGTVMVTGDNAIKFRAEVDKINEEHKDIVDAQSEYEETFARMLEKEIDIDIQPIKKEELKSQIAPKSMVSFIKAGLMV